MVCSHTALPVYSVHLHLDIAGFITSTNVCLVYVNVYGSESLQQYKFNHTLLYYYLDSGYRALIVSSSFKILFL